MRKRIIAVLTTAIILVPALTQSVFTQTPESVMPANTITSLNFELPDGRIKDLLEPLIVDLRGSKNEELLDIVSGLLLSGRRFGFGFAMPQDALVTVHTVSSEWDDIVAFLTKEGFTVSTHGSTEIYTSEGIGSAARVGELAVFGSSLTAIQSAIDLYDGTSTDSFGSLAGFREVSDSFLEPRVFSMSLNIDAIGDLLEGLMAESGTNEELSGINTIVNLFKFEGISIAEVSNGYKFTVEVLGDAEKLAENNISLNPGGTFTPNLFNKFPNAKPLFYSEAFNQKASNEHSQRVMNMLTENLGEDLDVYAQILEETGMDINAIYDVFEKESAFGLQYDANSPLPYLTAMGNVSGDNRAAAVDLAGDLVKLLTDALKDGDVPDSAYGVDTNGDITTVTMDLTKFEEDYNGPPFSEQVLTFGVTTDDLFIVSNYPGIDNASKRTGFGSDPNFSTYISDDMRNSGIFYMNMRNVWGWGDAMLAWGERAGGGDHGPPLDFYQGYYSALDALYKWKDMFIVSTGTASKVTVNGTITIDEATHKSYDQLLNDLKSGDRDGDGISDYDERYKYFTSVDSGDSDNDGVNDVEELRLGKNPKGEGQIFNDVSENAYYTDEVGLLYQRGAISGYDDGSFKPGKLVNRAEFATMVVKSFEQGTSNFLGIDVELSAKSPPFTDVTPGTWFHDPVAKAYAAGFISGSIDENGNLVFRPGDPIKRAEALAILNKASAALTKSLPATCADTPFDDVAQDDWFCAAVSNGYAKGVTSGRRAGEFDPHGLLNRAEAAVMIRRALEIDMEVFESGTESFGELTAPLGKSLTPAAGSLQNLF